MSLICKETGLVTAVDDDGFARVKVHRVEACHSCEAKGPCQALGGKREEVVLRVENTLGAKRGDLVVLGLPEVSVISASAAVYLIPASALIGGALLGADLGPSVGLSSDPAALIGAAAGLLVGLGATWAYSRRISANPKYVPWMIEVRRARAGEEEGVDRVEGEDFVEGERF
jgi:sigma-E factor negative regulatory protein RseC